MGQKEEGERSVPKDMEDNHETWDAVIEEDPDDHMYGVVSAMRMSNYRQLKRICESVGDIRANSGLAVEQARRIADNEDQIEVCWAEYQDLGELQEALGKFLTEWGKGT